MNNSETLNMKQVGLFLLQSGSTVFKLDDAGNKDLVFTSENESGDKIQIVLNQDKSWHFKTLKL